MAYSNSKKYEQDLAKIRQRVDEMEAETAWLIKHRFKIWSAYAVCFALILWVFF